MFRLSGLKYGTVSKRSDTNNTLAFYIRVSFSRNRFLTLFLQFEAICSSQSSSSKPLRQYMVSFECQVPETIEHLLDKCVNLSNHRASFLFTLRGVGAADRLPLDRFCPTGTVHRRRLVQRALNDFLESTLA